MTGRKQVVNWYGMAIIATIALVALVAGELFGLIDSKQAMHWIVNTSTTSSLGPIQCFGSSPRVASLGRRSVASLYTTSYT